MSYAPRVLRSFELGGRAAAFEAEENHPRFGGEQMLREHFDNPQHTWECRGPIPLCAYENKGHKP